MYSCRIIIITINKKKLDYEKKESYNKVEYEVNNIHDLTTRILSSLHHLTVTIELTPSKYDPLYTAF